MTFIGRMQREMRARMTAEVEIVRCLLLSVMRYECGLFLENIKVSCRLFLIGFEVFRLKDLATECFHIHEINAGNLAVSVTF